MVYNWKYICATPWSLLKCWSPCVIFKNDSNRNVVWCSLSFCLSSLKFSTPRLILGLRAASVVGFLEGDFFFFFLPLRWLNEEVCNSRRDFIFAWQRWHLRLFKFKTLSSRRCWAEQRDPMWTRGMLKSAWNLAEGFRCQAQQKGAIELEFARGERTPENTHTHTADERGGLFSNFTSLVSRFFYSIDFLTREWEGSMRPIKDQCLGVLKVN